jgi:FKBP-type peptidyl-prolyl cis-trans isomerase SlpA
MSNLSLPVVTEASYLTLHYRLASQEGEDIVSTFKESPATLQFGMGQLAPFLETCLLGLPEGTHQTFDLPPEQAFGPRNPELIQYRIGDLVEFAAPGGGQFAGVLREIDEQGALFDFNHPLAGQSLKFEVKIIGIL